MKEAIMGVAESLCELEVQARNASRADSLGGLDKETVQAMLGRLADALEAQQQVIRIALEQKNPLADEALKVANAITKKMLPDLYGQQGLSSEQVLKLMGTREAIYQTIIDTVGAKK